MMPDFNNHKFTVFQCLTSVIFFLVLVLNSSCERDAFPEKDSNDVILSSGQQKSDSWSSTYLNGKVILSITPGANPGNVKIIVNQLLINECQGMEDCNWIVLMISIEPSMIFNREITVNMEYDLDIINAELIFPYTGNPAIYYWRNMEDFDTQVNRGSLDYDIADKRIIFNTRRAGIFAIGINIPD